MSKLSGFLASMPAPVKHSAPRATNRQPAAPPSVGPTSAPSSLLMPSVLLKKRKVEPESKPAIPTQADVQPNPINSLLEEYGDVVQESDPISDDDNPPLPSYDFSKAMAETSAAVMNTGVVEEQVDAFANLPESAKRELARSGVVIENVRELKKTELISKGVTATDMHRAKREREVGGIEDAGTLARRKHQITSLLADYHNKEAEFEEMRRKSRTSKAETRSKYGW